MNTVTKVKWAAGSVRRPSFSRVVEVNVIPHYRPVMSVSVVSPPSYSVSPPHLPTPHYSSSPLQGEETILLTPRGNTLSAVSENVIKSCSFLTLIFKEQSNADTLPTYGSGSTIHGEIELKNIASVLNVEMKVSYHIVNRSATDKCSSSSKGACMHLSLAPGLYQLW
jgi:hypothetical protein